MQDQTKIGGITDLGGERTPAGFVPLGDFDTSSHLDLDAIRERLKGTRGREYWRSLEEVADTPAFRKYLEKEFPHQAPREMQPLNRRNFMQLMGATLALAGIGGCAYQPPEKIVPYLEQPESVVPGKPLFYATAFERGGYAIGLLGETHVGRPIKLEGNAEHPASLGGTDVFAQASLLGLYDPDRSQAVRHLGNEGTWENLQSALIEPLREVRRKQGNGLHIVIGASTSPTLANQIARLLKKYPGARIHRHEPASRDNVYAGARLAFGQELQPVYSFDQAARILSLDSDFLVEDPGSVRYAHDFMAKRRVRDGAKEMNRLYVVESASTLTGSNADHRIAVRPSQVEAVARAIAAAAGIGGGGAATLPEGVSQEWINAVAADLTGHRGTSLVIAGPTQPPAVHAIAHALNSALGNTGKTVRLIPTPELRFGAGDTLPALVQAMDANQVDILVLAGVNPAYTAPGDVNFRGALEKFSNTPRKLSIHLGLYDDETGTLCQWHVPQSHYLESWSDARAYDGTVSIIQPLLVPLYSSRTVHELFAALLEDGPQTPYDIVRGYWQTQMRSDFEGAWHRALTAGVVPNSAPAPRTVAAAATLPATSAAPEGQGLEISLRPDPTIWDGRFANNGWLQELPKPISTLTWDNAAYISPATAKQYNLKNNDLVTLQVAGRSLEIAVWIVPGQPENTVSLTLGYGRTRGGKLAAGTGFNTYTLRGVDTPWIAAGVQLSKTGRSYELAATQHHFLLGKERGLVKEGLLAEYLEHPNFAQVDPHAAGHGDGHGDGHAAAEKLPDNLYPPMWPSDRTKGAENEAGDYAAREEFGRAYNNQPIPAWGMVIDLNACIGCNACTIACQAENNIATVGKDMVLMNREMHWIRIDQYHTGEIEDPERVFMPVPCQHCEKAPCEPVCPVEATSHSAEGINEMTYNRCIGTRYCSNNCPYKVRRFNFLQFSDQSTPTIQMMRNPDVTVRSRGVMEKCTYCVQRVNWARMEAEKEDRVIRDGDVLTACQQVCPTEAIVFGNINDTYSNNNQGSRVRQLKNNPLNYGILTELNTFPRTTYLARLRNPNPTLEPAAAGGAHGGGHQESHEAPHDAGHGDAHGSAPGAAPGSAPAAGTAGHGAAPTQEGH